MIFSTDFAMAVAQVAIDPAPPDRMRGIVGIGDGEALEDPEVGLDQVQPRSIGRRPTSQTLVVALYYAVFASGVRAAQSMRWR
jgi:hypothetical protein